MTIYPKFQALIAKIREDRHVAPVEEEFLVNCIDGVIKSTWPGHVLPKGAMYDQLVEHLEEPIATMLSWVSAIGNHEDFSALVDELGFEFKFFVVFCTWFWCEGLTEKELVESFLPV